MKKNILLLISVVANVVLAYYFFQLREREAAPSLASAPTSRISTTPAHTTAVSAQNILSDLRQLKTELDRCSLPADLVTRLVVLRTRLA